MVLTARFMAQKNAVILLLNRQETPWNITCATVDLNIYICRPSQVNISTFPASNIHTVWVKLEPLICSPL